MVYRIYKHINKKQNVTVIDRLMGGAAIIHPLTAVPQVIAIYSTGDVSGISLWTWFSFMVLGLIFLLYGIVHKLRPFIVTQVLWFMVDFLIVAGVLMYR